MTQFTKSFIWKFILDIFILGLVVRLGQNTVISLMLESENGISTPVLIIYSIISAALSMLLICLIINWNIGTIFRKGCYDYPRDPDKWFRNLALIIIVSNILSGIYAFMEWSSNINEQYEQAEKLTTAFGGSSESLAQTRELISQLSTTLIICIIVENVVGISIMIMLLPKLKKKYSER